MATIETLFKIVAAVTGGEAVRALAQNIRDTSTAGENMRRSLVQGALALRGFATAVAVQELAAFIDKQIDLADKLNKASQKTGEQVDALDKWRKAAQLADVDFDSLISSVEKFNKNIVIAATGKGDAADAFAALGISIKDAGGHLKDTNTLLLETADKFRQFQDGPAKGAVAMALFGKSGADMIPLLNQGGDAVRAMATSMTKEFAAGAEEFNDNITKIKQSVGDVGIQIAKELLPGLNSIAEGFAKNNTAVEILTTDIKLLETAFVGLSQAASGITTYLAKKFDEIYINASELYTVLKDIATLDFKKINSDISDHQELLKNVGAAASEQFSNNNQMYQNQIGKIWDAPATPASRVAAAAPAAGSKQLNFNPGDVSKLTSQYESAAKAAEKFITKQQEELVTLAQESQYIGKTTIEIDKLKDARKFDTEVAEKMIGMSQAQKKAFLEQTNAIKQQRQELLQLNYDMSRTFDAGAKNFFAKYREDATNTAAQTQKVFSDAFQGAEDAWVRFTQTGKLDFKDMANSIIADLARMQFQQAVAGFLGGGSGGAGGGFSGLFSGLVGKATSWLGSFFANGGIMSSGGPLPLHAYASGGIANSPQMAIFGEGRMPEAYVPLPDGRSIPVNMRGGAGGNSVTYNIDARGADAGAVERIEDALKKVNASIEARAVNAVSYKMTRDPNYGRR